MLLCRRGPLPASRKNSRGWNLFAGLPYRFNTLHAKISYALGHSTSPLFFQLFPEAVLMTRKRKLSLKDVSYLIKVTSKAGKGLSEKRARVFCLQRGSFFLT
ncbi:MAG TPA: hypothetical protein VGN20_13395 [Mucilaginibacter sp.]|jgi:hypothetical protein